MKLDWFFVSIWSKNNFFFVNFYSVLKKWVESMKKVHLISKQNMYLYREWLQLSKAVELIYVIYLIHAVCYVVYFIDSRCILGCELTIIYITKIITATFKVYLYQQNYISKSNKMRKSNWIDRNRMFSIGYVH